MIRPSRIAIAVVVLLLALTAPTLLSFYTDWLWFGEVGYQSVFLTMIRAQGLLLIGAFALAAAWLVANIYLAVSGIGDLRPVFTTREGLEVALPGGRQLRSLGLGIATLLAMIVALYAAGHWETWLLWRNGVTFGEADPILGRDVSFYVFSLPFLQGIRGIAQALVILAALAAAALYLVSGSLTSGFPARLSMSRHARRHLSLLAAVFFLLLAWGAWLHRTEHLIETSGLVYGASYADVYGRMPAAFLVMAACVIGAALSVAQAFGDRNWPIPAAIGLYLAAAVGSEIYSSALQRFVVTPNEQERETPFIQHNIRGTRRAFALDGVEERELSGDARLTRDDIARNSATLDNVRLWDHAPLLDTFGQIQEIRTYYEFASVDNDRYRIGGALRQVMLSARELNSMNLPSRTWVNERLTYTHGIGLTLGPVNQVTSEGLPVLFIRNIPPETIPDLPISEPSIYFGERANEWVIVNTNTPEFHFPRGENNETTHYTGRGGVPLTSLWRKLLFAVRFGSYQIVLNDGIGPESRILFNRNIRQRVSTIAPFLAFDQDPYLVLAGGRLYWLFDAYTTSAQYPYSTPAGQVNYIRNSVKFVIDAFDGTTTAYLADPRDPIAATYARIFPGMLKPLASMPPEIRAHVRYPEDIFALQSQVYATFHMTQPSVFYNREDQWEIPAIGDGRENERMQPYYTIMRLPGERDAEFIQMLPFTPRRRDNLAAWLVARSDGEHYGRLRVFRFPKQNTVFGPRQVIARMLQDQVISPQITLWNQQGSQVIWGTLMVIPVEEALIYVRPLYLRSSGGRIPELTRVIVAFDNRIVMENTLEAGLARLFGGSAPPREPSTRETQAEGTPQTAASAPA
ncbi:MAG TPA: UPF0182 family protein, partial [Vicinamibacterales bacterium]|nr:UPF0182 family protein [Vicinamibacterales bacterium]